jgi:hypothetical protein
MVTVNGITVNGISAQWRSGKEEESEEGHRDHARP